MDEIAINQEKLEKFVNKDLESITIYDLKDMRVAIGTWGDLTNERNSYFLNIDNSLKIQIPVAIGVTVLIIFVLFIDEKKTKETT